MTTDAKTVAALIESCRRNADTKVLAGLMRKPHGQEAAIAVLIGDLPPSVFKDDRLRASTLDFLLELRAHSTATEIAARYDTLYDAVAKARIALAEGRFDEAATAYARAQQHAPGWSDQPLADRIADGKGRTMGNRDNNVVQLTSRRG